jgi:hypothetical protein
MNRVKVKRLNAPVSVEGSASCNKRAKLTRNRRLNTREKSTRHVRSGRLAWLAVQERQGGGRVRALIELALGVRGNRFNPLVVNPDCKPKRLLSVNSPRDAEPPPSNKESSESSAEELKK